jgi:1-acyl-sn-glycerol-3-phosphate acyltransferase
VPSTATARRSLELLYAGYAWLILLLFATPVVGACLLLPGLDRRRAVARWGAAAVLGLMGSRVAVSGKTLTRGDGVIVIANHQSYLDGIILTAVLPPRYTFLIKREMARVPIAGFVLSRLGSEFVDRDDASQRRRSARRLVKAARQGRALAVFPEGTFDGAPGLKSFHLGAFRVARRASLAVAPVVIRGARAKLPSDCWLPRPGPLAVEFCPRIAARDYADEFALVRATRTAMLARLGEPDLGEPDLRETDLDETVPASAETAAAADLPG